MKHAEGTLKEPTGHNLFYQYWLPDRNPKAVLMIVHGLAEHRGRYMNLVNYFVPRAYAVCGFDYRGHGKSEGLRGYVDRFSDYVSDVRAFFEKVHQDHTNLKIFLVGHSMGATIAVAYAVQYQRDLAGLIISGVGLKPGASISPALKAIARLISRFSPKTGLTVLDASAISSDKAVVDAYVNDPLVYRGKISARLGAEMINTIDRLPSLMPQIKLPILIMHGTADRLCNPEGSQIVYNLVGSQDKTLKLYEGFYHEIFNEPEYKKVMADVETWLSAHL